MQPGTGGLADCIKAGDVGARGKVGNNAAAGEMGGGYDRNPLLGDVDAEFHATAVDIGKMLAQKVG